MSFQKLMKIQIFMRSFDPGSRTNAGSVPNTAKSGARRPVLALVNPSGGWLPWVTCPSGRRHIERMLEPHRSSNRMVERRKRKLLRLRCVLGEVTAPQGRGHNRPERVISHIGTEHDPIPTGEAAVGRSSQWTQSDGATPREVKGFRIVNSVVREEQVLGNC